MDKYIDKCLNKYLDKEIVYYFDNREHYGVMNLDVKFRKLSDENLEILCLRLLEKVHNYIEGTDKINPYIIRDNLRVDKNKVTFTFKLYPNPGTFKKRIRKKLEFQVHDNGKCVYNCGDFPISSDGRIPGDYKTYICLLCAYNGEDLDELFELHIQYLREKNESEKLEIMLFLENPLPEVIQIPMYLNDPLTLILTQ